MAEGLQEVVPLHFYCVDDEHRIDKVRGVFLEKVTGFNTLELIANSNSFLEEAYESCVSSYNHNSHKSPRLSYAFSTPAASTIPPLDGRIAFGLNAGKYVTKIGPGFGYGEEIPFAKGKRCFSINGFSIHANTSVNALHREKLDKLIRYMARGPLSNERVEIRKDSRMSSLLFSAPEAPLL